jgi:hypothetical protein
MPLWFEILVVVAVACLFVWYISPDRSSSPSMLRKFVAISWIVFRRIVCFSGAIFGIFAIYVVWISNGETTIEKIFTSLIVFVMSGYFVYIGIVGFAKFENEINLYKRIKKKYGIRW